MNIAMPVAPVPPRASLTRTLPNNAVAAAPANQQRVKRISRDSGLTPMASAPPWEMMVAVALVVSLTPALSRRAKRTRSAFGATFSAIERDMAASGPLVLLSLPRFAVARNAMR